MSCRFACGVASLASLVVCPAPVLAQFGARTAPSLIRQVAATSHGELRGTVLDDRGQPLPGAVVSAVGATSVFAVTERDGSFLLRSLPAGPYLVRVHLKGYSAPKSRLVQVNGSTTPLPALTMTARGQAREVLEAGVGTSGTDATVAQAEAPIDQGEVAWRLRHVKRSVLKDVAASPVDTTSGEQPAWLPGRVLGRVNDAANWFAELPFYGRFDLLTATSFDRTQDLLSLELSAPTGVTAFALSAPTPGGEWSVQAGLTQGSIASWIVSSAFARRGEASHHYEAGVSYSAQRYLGGNAYLPATLSDGNRSGGEVYASDRWSASPHLEVSYGAKYGRYDYLNDRGLWSPEVSVTVAPDLESSFRLRASASRREVAPGAGEFAAPSTGPLLPSQRTFSALAWRNGFARERVDTVDVSIERQYVGDVTIGLRAFTQRVDGQAVTLFGMPQAGSPIASIGHYFVAGGGNFDARGWGISVGRRMLEGLRASVDYTVTDADWSDGGLDSSRLSRVAASTVRTGQERTYDLRTSIESEIPQSATRFFVVYRLNTGFASSDASTSSRTLGSRFDVQINQGLPFMRFAASQWEMLLTVRNMFHDATSGASVYDELLVVRAPTRMVGGLSVRF